MSFRLVPKSVTFNDLERRNGRYIALFHWIWYTCVPTHNRVDLWRNLCTSLLYFVLRVRFRHKESSRLLSHLLMSFLSDSASYQLLLELKGCIRVTVECHNFVSGCCYHMTFTRVGPVITPIISSGSCWNNDCFADGVVCVILAKTHQPASKRRLPIIRS